MMVNVCLHFAEDVEKEEEEKVLSGRLKKQAHDLGHCLGELIALKQGSAF